MGNYKYSTKEFDIELQGSTLLCGMCAVNNFQFQYFNQAKIMNLIADCLWLKQAIISDLQHEFNQRSHLGDYNIDVLTCALKQENYRVRHLHNDIVTFFANCCPEDIDVNPQKLFSSLLNHLQRAINPGDRV